MIGKDASPVNMNHDLQRLTLDDEESNSQLTQGTLTFGEEPGQHSETGEHIKSWANVQRGHIIHNTKAEIENGNVDSNNVITTNNGTTNTAVFPVLKLEVVSARTVDLENEKKHVAYTVMVRKDGLLPDPYPAVIERRYTEFLELYDTLRLENPTLMTRVVFPKKVLLRNFDPSLISERSSYFEELLRHTAAEEKLRNSVSFNKFLQYREHLEARKWMELKRYDQAVPLLENSFRLLNKLHTDRHPEVLLALCRLVACCNADPLGTSAERFAELALHRYEAVSDTDLLKYYIPLLQLCVHLWWKLGKDKRFLEKRLEDFKRRGMSIDGGPSLMDALIRDGLL